MTNLQTTSSDATALDRFGKLLRRVVEPHASLNNPSIRVRVQMTNISALLLAAVVAVGLLFNYRVFVNFSYALLVGILAFVFGKTKLYNIGSFIFSLGLLSIGYVSLYIGYANNYLLNVILTIPVALILINSLTSVNAFALFTLFAALAAYLAPYYSKTLVLTDDVNRATWLVIVIGIILYATNAVRSGVERNFLKEFRSRTNQIQEAKSEVTRVSAERDEIATEARKQITEQIDRIKKLAELSQEISSSAAQNSQDFLTFAANIVSEKLDYYHVGIFLLNKNRQYAELRAANSEGGQRMLARRHQLKVGGMGIVGYVSQSGYPRIALSTGEDAVFFNNPDLPNTQSEMAMPLKVGSKVIGVLDVQSTESSAFTEEDIDAFTTLSNQIALVIQNISSDEEGFGMEGKNAKKNSSATAESRSETKNGYTYMPDGSIASAVESPNSIVEKAISTGSSIALPASSRTPQSVMAIPVKIRDNVIGYIHVEASDNIRKWTEDEIALVQSISERAALALENARLFEETERRAEQEQAMARITARIGESANFEHILQTTIQEIGRALGAKRTFIQLDAPAAESSPSADQGM